MRKLILASALAFSAPFLVTGVALAQEQVQARDQVHMLAVGDMLGTDPDMIRARLTELGYEVRKIGREDGMIEVYALQGKMMYELYVDPASGKLVRFAGED